MYDFPKAVVTFPRFPKVVVITLLYAKLSCTKIVSELVPERGPPR